MSTDLSQSLNPLRLAKAGENLEGSIPLDTMTRVADLLLVNEGEINYCLSFTTKDSGLCVIESEIIGCLSLKCQRCLKPVVINICKQTQLGVVNNKDELEFLEKEYEPFLLNEGVFNVKELVEDELLLAIPLSPLHPVEQCPGTKELDRINADGTGLRSFGDRGHGSRGPSTERT